MVGDRIAVASAFRAPCCSLGLPLLSKSWLFINSRVPWHSWLPLSGCAPQPGFLSWHAPIFAHAAFRTRGKLQLLLSVVRGSFVAPLLLRCMLFKPVFGDVGFVAAVGRGRLSVPAVVHGLGTTEFWPFSAKRCLALTARCKGTFGAYIAIRTQCRTR